MLILTRQVDDRIIIRVPGLNDPITIMVVEITRYKGCPQVKLGIAAPKYVAVHREEIDNHPEGTMTIERWKSIARTLSYARTGVNAVMLPDIHDDDYLSGLMDEMEYDLDSVSRNLERAAEYVESKIKEETDATRPTGNDGTASPADR